MAEAADAEEVMIKEDQDRMDCLRLAVQLLMPRSSGMPRRNQPKPPLTLPVSFMRSRQDQPMPTESKT